MSKRARWIIAALLLLLAGAAAGLWAWRTPARQEETVQGQEFKVQRGPVRRLVTSTGTVKPQVGAEVKVGTRVSGRVERLLVAIGQEVKAGQVVAVIEHADLLAKVNQAEAELNEARVKLSQARVDLKRQRSLKAEDLVSQDSLDKAVQQMEVLAAQEASARARLVTAKVSLDFATVRAPISGVVATISTQEGETVAASFNAPTFMTIVDLGRLQVEDYVDETDVGLVEVGQTGFFSVEAFAERRFQAEVQAIRPAAKLVDDVVYYTVDLKITDEYRGLLKPEMTANVSLVVDAHPEALWVPPDAVRRKGGSSLVHLPAEGRTTQREVRTGWSEPDRVEILDGLGEGQTVIVPQRRGPEQAGRPPRFP